MSNSLDYAFRGLPFCRPTRNTDTSTLDYAYLGLPFVGIYTPDLFTTLQGISASNTSEILADAFFGGLISSLAKKGISEFLGNLIAESVGDFLQAANFADLSSLPNPLTGNTYLMIAYDTGIHRLVYWTSSTPGILPLSTIPSLSSPSNLIHVAIVHKVL